MVQITNPTETIGKKTYEVSTELRELGEAVIEKYNPNAIKDTPTKIEYLLVYPNINKKTVGRCIKSRPEYKFLSGFHFVIEMSGDIWDKLNDDTKEIVMYHELLHANASMNDKTGDWRYSIKDHDVKDFYVLIKKWGVDWFENLKTQVSSIYDLDPEEADEVSL